jgi:adenylate cyclase
VPVYDGDQPPDRRIRFRIGINIGDVIAHGMDLHGDGVNIAARLEALCPVGGLCVSRSVYDHVRGGLDLPFEAIGPLTLKNIARPVEAFVLRLDPAAQEPATEAEASPQAHSRTTLFAGLAGLLLVGAVGGTGWWMLRDRTSLPVASAIAPVAPHPAPYSPQDRRQSVITLPFENSSGDPTQDNLATTITHDVHDRIAEDTTKPLIPAATASAYRGKTLDLHAIGREHDVHFALTGDARRQDGRLIVSATLYETADARPLWSQRFDRPDSPDALGNIAMDITMSVDQATMDAEGKRATRDHPDSLDKRDLMFASRVTSLAPTLEPNLRARIALIERSLALDPNYVWALRDEAFCRALLVLNGFSSNREADLIRATKASDRALQLAPNDIAGLRIKATVLRVKGDLDEAAALARKVIGLAPEWGWAHRDLGQILLMQGHYKEALENLVSAKQLVSVRGADSVAFIDMTLALGLLVNDRFAEAIQQARLAIAGMPPGAGSGTESAWLTLIAAESANGQDAEARADMQKFLATPRTWRTMAAVQKSDYFVKLPNLIDGLRRAGMPAE